MTSHTDAYITSADVILIEQLDYKEPEIARIQVAQAQVHAIKAVAAALDRLAEAVENLDVGR